MDLIIKVVVEVNYNIGEREVGLKILHFFRLFFIENKVFCKLLIVAISDQYLSFSIALIVFKKKKLG